MKEKTLHSTHILMFPFVFNEEPKIINEALVENSLWTYIPFDISKSQQNYNEYIYFYEYVRKALYSNKSMDEKQTSYYFEYKEQKGTYELEVNDKKYKLDIDGISMRTFDTNVGILSIELSNYEYRDPESILVINDFARRLYPQFLAGKNNLEYVKNNLLPQSVTLYLSEKIEEDYSYYEDMKNIQKDATNLPNFIHALLGDKFTSHSNDNKIHIEPIIDDRMFVVSMYMHDDIVEEMKKYDEDKNAYAYENDDFWYKYIFVDAGDKMCQNKHMTKNLIKETTYERWIEWGTLFGISRYSFVALTGQWFGENRLKPHMHTMYFQIFTLLLAYRASMLNFSKRVADVSVGDRGVQELQAEVTAIYKDYINFQNNLFFRELTAQEQGIELYNQALKVMQTEKHIKDLDNEIAELHTYVSMKMQEEESKKAEDREKQLATISKLGALFLPPTVIAGILGMNTINFAKNDDGMYWGGALIVLSVLFGFGVIKKGWTKYISIGLLTVILVISLFFMPMATESRVDKTKNHIKTKETKDVNKSNG
ncbi:MAG: CorA family divalent cation transporter [Campylobacterota bacterium]|nr:CorA family divalent cation transporter [Campylobacterota bacterium]